MLSYDPRTDQWRSESPLPLGNYRDRLESDLSIISAVAHEGRLVVAGIPSAPLLALVGDVWTELPPLPPGRDNFEFVYAASLRLE